MLSGRHSAEEWGLMPCCGFNVQAAARSHAQFARRWAWLLGACQHHPHAALTSVAQRNLNAEDRLQLRISHMGFVLIASRAVSALGTARLLQMFSHA